MKSAKKAIIAALCAVMLVVGSVAGTMAYLTSQDSVTNTFTVGNVAITLDELDTDNDNKTSDNVTINNEVRDKANAYKLVPGNTYTKDPIVRVASGSEDCYLFVKVVNEIIAIEDSSSTVTSQMDAKGWEAVEGQAGVYVYTQGATDPAIVHGNTNVPVFNNFTISGDVNNTTLAGYNNKTITVTAYAVQKDGFESKTPAEIWSAAGFN